MDGGRGGRKKPGWSGAIAGWDRGTAGWRSEEEGEDEWRDGQKKQKGWGMDGYMWR